MWSPIAAQRQGALRAAALACVATALTLAGCAADRAPPAPSRVSSGRVQAYNRPYQVRGRWYAPHAQPGYDAVGMASWYSYEAPSRRTADGEPFDIRVASAAHPTLPIPSWLEVTNLDNGRSARVRLNDRGPFAPGRLIDVSRAAAVELGFERQGTARVRVRYLGPAAPFGGAPIWTASAAPQRRPPPSPPPPAGEAEAVTPPPDPRAEVAEDAAAFSDEDAAATPVVTEPAAARFEVQAAAFADRASAERAAARLAAAGQARVEPLRHGEAVLYRVLVGAWPQARDAETARGQATALGFTDAQVIAR